MEEGLKELLTELSIATVAICCVLAFSRYCIKEFKQADTFDDDLEH